MTRFVALLRAVNVGGRTVKMAALRDAFEDLGFGDVSTFIASGNVLFRASGKAAVLERRIEETLAAEFAMDIPTMLRDGPALSAATHVVVPEGAAWYVAFLKSAPTKAAVAKLRTFENDVDRFVVTDREVHWSCQKRQSESKFSNAKLEQALGVSATMRSITTVRKLAALLS